MKKRIFLLACALVIVCAMAISAAAATTYTDGTYEGCSYSTFTQCSANTTNSIIEITMSNDSYQNYLFRVTAKLYAKEIVYVGDEAVETERHCETIYGGPTTRIANAYKATSYELAKVVSTYRINEYSLSPITVRAS